MKRPPAKIRGVRLGRVLENFTPAQLAGIGAIMMTYNEAETLLHDLVGTVIGFPGDSHQIVSRINGTEGMVEIILVGSVHCGIGREIAEPTLGLKNQGFSYLKPYRDAVTHARIYDASSGIAKVPKNKGRREEILLSVPALEWLTEQFSILTDEMRELLDAFQLAKRLYRDPKPDDKHRARLEESVLASLARCQSHRNERLSLKQPPKFPEEPASIRWGKPSDPLSFSVTTGRDDG